MRPFIFYRKADSPRGPSVLGHRFYAVSMAYHTLNVKRFRIFIWG